MPRKDLNTAAFAIVQQATSEVVPAESAAAKMGRTGGLKGGKVRQAQMSPEERVALAKKAAQTRWAKKKVIEPSANDSTKRPHPKIKVVV